MKKRQNCSGRHESHGKTLFFQDPEGWCELLVVVLSILALSPSEIVRNQKVLKVVGKIILNGTMSLANSKYTAQSNCALGRVPIILCSRTPKTNSTVPNISFHYFSANCFSMHPPSQVKRESCFRMRKSHWLDFLSCWWTTDSLRGGVCIGKLGRNLSSQMQGWKSIVSDVIGPYVCIHVRPGCLVEIGQTTTLIHSYQAMHKNAVEQFISMTAACKPVCEDCASSALSMNLSSLPLLYSPVLYPHDCDQCLALDYQGDTPHHLKASQDSSSFVRSQGAVLCLLLRFK